MTDIRSVARGIGAMGLWLALAGCGGAPDGAGASEDPATAAERAGLVARRDQVAADQAAVGAFRVAGTRYRLEAQDTGWSRPYLDLVMENGTALTVTRFTVQASLESPGRAQPWMQQALQVPVPGGIAPGATHTVTLTPSPDSPWALANATPDAAMKVRVLDVTASTGQVYLGDGSFSPDDARRLAQLDGAP